MANRMLARMPLVLVPMIDSDPPRAVRPLDFRAGMRRISPMFNNQSNTLLVGGVWTATVHDALPIRVTAIGVIQAIRGPISVVLPIGDGGTPIECPGDHLMWFSPWPLHVGVDGKLCAAPNNAIEAAGVADLTTAYRAGVIGGDTRPRDKDPETGDAMDRR